MTAACLMTRCEQVVGAGGASRDRTDDLRVANATLSQLSYGPVLNIGLVLAARILDAETQRDMVGLGGVEPPTSPLSGVRSNQLSYRPPMRSIHGDPASEIKGQRRVALAGTNYDWNR